MRHYDFLIIDTQETMEFPFDFDHFQRPPIVGDLNLVFSKSKRRIFNSEIVNYDIIKNLYYIKLLEECTWATNAFDVGNSRIDGWIITNDE